MVASMVVAPTDLTVAGPLPGGGSWLTLTTCNPRYSAATRLVVRARLVGQQASVSTSRPSTVSIARSADLSGSSAVAVAPRAATRPPTWGTAAAWFLALFSLALGTTILGRRVAGPVRVVLIAGSGLLGAAVLWFLFGAIAALLPAGY
jgi:hypothetical protein